MEAASLERSEATVLLRDEGAAPDEGCDKKQPRLAEFEEKVGIRHRSG